MVMLSAGSGIFRIATVVLTALLGMCWAISTPASASSELEMSGFVIVQETDTGRWEIQARKASYMDEKEVLLKGVSAKMFADGEERIRVKSETGRFDSDRLVLHLEGNVTITSRWGSSLQAPVVRWDGLGDYLEASGGVSLQRGAIMVYGTSGRYTVETGTALILGKVRTILEKGDMSP